MSPVELKLLEHLSQFVTDHKKDFVERVLAHRTRYVTVVLENIYQSQNASAVIRTAECMGVQDIHVVEDTAKYELNIRVLRGSNKWVTIRRYKDRTINNTEACFAQLRSQGYRILVADPAEDGVAIDELDANDGKMALVFGNELRGPSDFCLRHADEKVRIPMFGFTESLNVSVSAAISMQTVMGKLRKSNVPIELSEQEKAELRLAWYRKIVRRSDVHEREFLRTFE